MSLLKTFICPRLPQDSCHPLPLRSSCALSLYMESCSVAGIIFAHWHFDFFLKYIHQMCLGEMQKGEKICSNVLLFVNEQRCHGREKIVEDKEHVNSCAHSTWSWVIKGSTYRIKMSFQYWFSWGYMLQEKKKDVPNALVLMTEPHGRITDE